MKLGKVKIHNFRSIKEMEITTEPPCQVFVGEMEAGKSNILKAISFLDESAAIRKTDVREGDPDEIVADSYIEYELLLDTDEKEEAYQILSDRIYGNLEELFDSGAKRKGTVDRLWKRISVKLIVDFKMENRRVEVHVADDSSVDYRWKDISKNQPESDTQTIDGEVVDLTLYKLADTRRLMLLEDAELDEVTVEGLNNIFTEILSDFINDNIPPVIFWEYREENLLPAKLNKESFCEKPSSCLPLQAMFRLAGINNIKDAIIEAEEKGRNRLSNLYEKVAKTTTNHFIKVWPEYKNVKFSVEPDGEFIRIGIRETYNDYDLADRSDGFKRLVTFLLHISIKNAMERLGNSIIIIDEPEISIHIKGQRYLLKELIDISKRNLVYYSTHSIFMVDKDRADRHLIVKKKNEVTTIERVEESNYADEEVVFNALGYSLFESIKKQNVIFEGWTDYKLFKTAITRVPKEYNTHIKGLKNIGLCFADGVKDVKNIAKMLDLAEREYIVVSDSDEPAKQKQKEFSEHYQDIWYRYDQLYTERIAVTSEDFIKSKHIIDVVSEVAIDYDVDSIDATVILNASGGRMKAIRDELHRQKVNPDVVKNIEKAIKRSVFGALKPGHIEEDYYKVLATIADLWNNK